jgi:hypothetical protein
MEKIKLTKKQKLWLISRSGRNIKDVVMFNGKPSVVMWNGELHEPYFKQIPPNNKINLVVNKDGYVYSPH